MKINIKDLKQVMSKISLAVEKSKLNPKSGWIEIEALDNKIIFKVSNFNYYLEVSTPIESNSNLFHVTLLAETFIPLISKLDVDSVDIYEKLNSLILDTGNSQYTFPLIKELGKTKLLDKIDFKATTQSITLNGKDLATIATTNSKGLISAIFAKEIQQYIYVDNNGAITFTENIYINNFKLPSEQSFKMLLTGSQAKLLEIFDSSDHVEISFENTPTFNKTTTFTNKVCLTADDIQLILIAQPLDITDEFPSIRLRTLAESTLNTHVVVDKKLLDKALARLMVFDKSFDMSILDYSKIVFKTDGLELVSIKNKNIEKLPYLSSTNVIEHTSIIRFADLVKQLKAITSKELDISYGDRPAIVLNGNVMQLIPEIVTKGVNKV